jgi:hypothetical protein
VSYTGARAVVLPLVGLMLSAVVASASAAQASPPADSLADEAKPVSSEPAASNPAPTDPVIANPLRGRSGLTLPRATPRAASKASVARRNQASPYHGMKVSEKARTYYPAAWGVDRLRVSYTSSGNLIRFSYRITEPKLAKALGDHEATPYLFAPRTNAMLQVPTMEKIGQLRQLGTVEANKDYWMVFSNKGNLVRPGERVNIIIGKFHADGLLVE